MSYKMDNNFLNPPPKKDKENYFQKIAREDREKKQAVVDAKQAKIDKKICKNGLII